ncbi:MAG TPA: nuclear transport factor 2 family protein [Solirubrobacteraceae bacterium]
MLRPHQADHFAHDWIAAWNDHDLDRVLSHYRDDVVFTSPFAVLHAEARDGVVLGRPALRRYFQRALQAYPDLHFEPYGVLAGVSSAAVHYRSVGGREAIEVMEFDSQRQVRRAAGHYSDPPTAGTS